MAMECRGGVQLTFTLTISPPQPADRTPPTVNVTTTSSTATDGQDFEGLSAQPVSLGLVLDPLTTTTVSVNVFGDFVDEAAETSPSHSQTRPTASSSPTARRPAPSSMPHPLPPSRSAAPTGR
jgi:hypothetical protein